MDLDTYSFIDQLKDQKQVSFDLILPILTCEMEEMGKKINFDESIFTSYFRKNSSEEKKI